MENHRTGWSKLAVEWGARALIYGRAAHFFSQLRGLQGLSRLVFSKEFPTRLRDQKLEKEVVGALFELLKRDAAKFGSGEYSLRMLKTENPVRHGLRMARLLQDGLRIQRQKRRGRTTEFTDQAKEYAEELPRYYRRNFHFQHDGYLSSGSAELYEHQVEILFGGAGDAMRRMALEPLSERWPEGDGRGLRILEVGAGTGRASRMLRLRFPKAHLTVTDLSDPYLKHARRQLEASDRVDFVQCPGEALPFQSQQFDAVVSVFLFHELPEAVREQVLSEARRVVKKGGLVVAVDSVQRVDFPEWGPVLDQFSVDFHEPFYRNYIDSPLEGVFEKTGMTAVQKRIGFVSKLVWGQSPD
ncbi:MAG: hypothetical protein RJB38_1347 [Pseudomonadota bacterium]|jgi:ubiquinone/menaquinone biosynthesis C-methylase UbiE